MDYPTDKLAPNFFATLNARALELSASGADVIRLDIGSPNFPPPPHIVQALSEAAACADSHGYQSHHQDRQDRNAYPPC